MNKQKIIRFEDSERIFKCPVCMEALYLKDKSLLCKNKHCFDISKHGYINFILNAKSQKDYNKNSFENRRIILERGIYNHILKEIIDFLNDTSSISRVLDVGCGEGFYANQIYQATNKEVCAFDISKESIQLAAKRDTSNSVKWFVADLAHLPMKNQSVDCILDIFSPANYCEFHRILTSDGYLVKIIPGNEHLKELREKAREYLKNKDYSNQQIVNYFENHFSTICRKKITAQYEISANEREALINMTPLLFNVNKENIDWTEINHITIEAEILIGRP
ncbi:methyltransferase domain-containing protein [Clostridium tetani]|uniref:methyltransferase domain-containing protein n=1 Tax=Clostridium tetani TaxID=1513 RepID=UPI00100A37F3|nr:methyltransferase domain-containing protein [Clostridium tetani]RXM56740.1 rRNA (guanine-N1)-methyltransferase [Clostridium tetani]RXM74231.1 rRNA (guanine-N1)-methyltransferase [Clostridium tetani]RYU98035.1 rRNA (guanine-N1)-methyltransferase [Clostridium tetani]